MKIGDWYALKADTTKRGRVVHMLRKSVKLAMNGNNEVCEVYYISDLEPVAGPVGTVPAVWRGVLPGGKS